MTAVLPRLVPLLLPPNPTREAADSNRGGTSAELEPHCYLWPRAVLPLEAISGTVAPARWYYRWLFPSATSMITIYSKEEERSWGCEKDVYVLIPP